MAGESVRSFHNRMMLGTGPYMDDAVYSAHITAMGTQAEAGMVADLNLNKSAILALFPGPLRLLLTFSWSCLEKVVGILKSAAVKSVLGYLANKTIQEVAALLVGNEQRS